MTSTKETDPFGTWRQLLSSWESNTNDLAKRMMESEDFRRTMNQATGASVNAQAALTQAMERQLNAMNLPSRSQLANMGERLQAIEAQLSEIKALLYQVHQGTAAAGRATAMPRPPRTRRPPGTSGGAPS
ncbi:poly(R)-hydroxyalkanoic acid synthase subunit PhaE [Vineibacter terrae]|uniref:poly(R)-hydroxyalkanoic acid synthase subunit PhaE n=1 Tax=Vineibacter terrae TaxID=2586908 RepID=UPI0015B4C041|nr:poly(R)-hydroxyalkanoic acid synthase subunit PhaE [Vineibacter terrae]